MVKLITGILAKKSQTILFSTQSNGIIWNSLTGFK